MVFTVVMRSRPLCQYITAECTLIFAARTRVMMAFNSPSTPPEAVTP